MAEDVERRLTTLEAFKDRLMSNGFFVRRDLWDAWSRGISEEIDAIKQEFERDRRAREDSQRAAADARKAMNRVLVAAVLSIFVSIISGIVVALTVATVAR